MGIALIVKLLNARKILENNLGECSTLYNVNVAYHFLNMFIFYCEIYAYRN